MTDTQELIDSATGLMDKVGQALVSVTEKYGPKVADLTLEVARIMAMKQCAIGVASFLVSLLTFYYCYTWLKKPSTSDAEDALFMAAGIATIVSAFMSGTHILKIHAWIGMFKPEVYLAYETVEKLL